ncbi:UDP-glycosyltransferase 89B2 [Rosa rugosa]|uniref:UDP-glycosyltransferase 89B2 n=1 Tax=Rosa rugosa TaxID=74645 RepID=UPI002B400A97|nr:UDP-glycosyltransferase 89B2 [Rosa rugosa]
MTTTAKVHVLVFPYPAQGHMLPLLDLTHQLATRGVSITILVTPKNLPILNPILSKHPSIKTLVLPFPPHPSIPPGFENVKDLPIHAFVSMMCALHDLHRPIVEWFRSHPDPPSAIISDMFLGWTHHLAQELGIKRFEFSPSGALALSVIYGLWRNMPKKDDPNDESQVVSFPEVPNCPKYPWWQLSTVYRSYVAGDPVSEFIKEGFWGNMESWGLVVNSFTELERVYLEYLRKDLGHDRVWAVGPLLPPENDDPSGPVQRGGSGSVSVEEIKSWLDAREDRTVVYVCFGSQAVLTNDQVRELALGMENSGVHFVLCVKEPTKGGHVEGGDCAMPQGFEDRVAGRGLVIRGWAPQVVILKHRAVGAFLTHCGWNSVLEGVVAGVALLCWPMGADQFSNATLLVEQLKVGIRVCEGARTVPDANALARAVADSVSEKHVGIRERVKALREAALETVREGGSSVKELDGLVDQINQR